MTLAPWTAGPLVILGVLEIVGEVHGHSWSAGRAGRTGSSRPVAASGPAADVHREGGALGGQRRRDVGQADGGLRGWATWCRWSPRPTCWPSWSTAKPWRAMPGLGERRSRPACGTGPASFWREQGVAADEVALVELDHPAQPGLERRGRVVHVVAVEPVGHLEPQRVAGAQAGRDRAPRPARPPGAPPRASRRSAGGQKSSKPSSPV